MFAFKWLTVNNYHRKLDQVSFYLDSELVVKQLRGEYRVKKENLKFSFAKIKEMEKKFSLVKYAHVLRNNNKAADDLVNKKLNEIEMKVN